MNPRVPVGIAISGVVAFAPWLAGGGSPGALLPWHAFALGVVLLLSQPRLGLKQMVRDPEDRHTALRIYVTTIAMVSVSLFEHVREGATGDAVLPCAAGLMMSGLGLWLRLAAIRTLGRWFTSVVHVEQGQPVITAGPYRWLRHPSYTGALLAYLGVVVACDSPCGSLALFVLVVPAYQARIKVEERSLLLVLSGYSEYRVRAWGLIPFLR